MKVGNWVFGKIYVWDALVVLKSNGRFWGGDSSATVLNEKSHRSWKIGNYVEERERER
jgi:hypothetical protein